MNNVRELIRKININETISTEEPMHLHTTFRVGGPADYYYRPANTERLQSVLKKIGRQGVPIYFLGKGSNVLVSDAGIRGLVIDLSILDSVSVIDTRVIAQSGAEISTVSEIAADHRLSGLEFIYAMPGSTGGAVWMNARCYGVSIAEKIEFVEILDSQYEKQIVYPRSSDFGYKYSIFQKSGDIILSAGFRLQKVSSATLIREQMEQHKSDRTSKGHFQYPCAGSVFKNNRCFGMPTGKIIDSLGLRGYSIGGAKISDLHANIIVNTGTASAADILALIEFIEKTVSSELGFRLEREVVLMGDWENKR